MIDVRPAVAADAEAVARIYVDSWNAGFGDRIGVQIFDEVWRTGVGSALMSTALRALTEDFREAILWTVAGYERGHRFYEATGWSPDGATRADGREVSFRRNAL